MKLRSKAAALLLLALAVLLLALLSLRARRDPEPPGFPARPEAAPQRRHAPVPTLPPEPRAFPGAAGRRSPRRQPPRLRPRAGRPRAASREKLARRPGETRSLHSVPPELWIHLAVVACGNRLEETLVMLKSAVLFSHRKMRFHIFTEDALKPEFDKQLRQWPDSYTKKFEHRLYPITFSVGNPQEWKKLFKPCAAQRLFLPAILKDVDSLLYVDTDVLFLRPVDDIWKLLRQFNSTQLAAMAPEHEIPKIGWYSRFARHPFYGSAGVNSGVMLMNLTRIRNTQFKNSLIPAGLAWEEMLLPLYQKYKSAITWGDQDLLNIIFYYNPECLYVFPCQWNYRPDHCMYGSNCKEAEREGVSVLHGNRGVYHDDKQPTFRALYEAIRDFPFQDNLFQSMYYPLQLKFLETVHTLCGRIPQVFLKQIEKTMRRAYEKHVIIHMGPNPMS
ncbi:glucoside xylosyltransferase 2 precursor [Mus musculus]|uniref:Glucoside xylosyltransferase 2 n=1 Tax=Mus musculus TaxID=10090 RepID=GXLT2_MOUSE|nr:glucoside xylosyltransferase 2 precursor [Mus musculus]Q810K9.1 RecName: Full=Glucoside xylosyltransferase 2; AltName: Full=Glycosyltransferase 8 domain-containing protein 4 [Mus musculus]AAH49816.1 Glycosyltransferase 8 domain containing 4 [Mus musculus]|eukprot:NP_941014.1 glucoside xylosyltransferase 2 precursor [Mus musculus]